MSVDVLVLPLSFFFVCFFEIVSYFENIPSLQSRSIGLIVAHVNVSVFQGKKICVARMKILGDDTQRP